MIYLDFAATAPVRREVLEAMWPFVSGDFGNPSSTHELGERAARALAEARESVAQWLGVRATELTFTSGGTESANLAIKGIALANPRGRHIISSPTEHDAVLESCDFLRRHHGFDVSLVPVDSTGSIDPSELAALIRPDSTLISIMHANNEIGTVHDLASLTSLADVPFHSDAVQAAGALDIRPATTGVSALSLSGHKLGAPKGIGLLWVRRGLRLEPLVHGGGQERGIRSGTENVAGAVALAAAIGSLGDPKRAALARDAFIEHVLATVPGASLTGHPQLRLPGHASFTFAGVSGEAVLLELERRGIVSSSGSACAAGSTEPSRVLTAIGIDAELAHTAVRFTFDETAASQLPAAAIAVREAVVAVSGIGA